MTTTTNELKEMLEEAKRDACRVSYTEECVQHVNAQLCEGLVIGYSVSDWYDNSTITSFANGLKLG